MSSLYFACNRGHHGVAQTLLAAGANVEAVTNTGATPLMSACKNGHVRVVEALLAAGANIEAAHEGSGDMTPLASASLNGHLPVVKLLLDAGANIETPEEDDWSPLQFAAAKGHIEVVETLLAVGARNNTHDKNGSTPLHSACWYGHAAVVEILIAAGANIDTQNNESTTALFMACQNGHLAVVERLLAAGANPDILRETLKPIDIAKEKDFPDIVSLLSRPVPDSTVTEFQQRIGDIKPRQKEAKERNRLPQQRLPPSHILSSLPASSPCCAVRRWDSFSCITCKVESSSQSISAHLETPSRAIV